MEGNFTKMIYAHPWFTMNALYLLVLIDIQNVDIVSGKMFVFYQCDCLEEIKSIEKQVLENYQQTFRCFYKKMVFKWEAQMKKQCLCIPIQNGENLEYRVGNWNHWYEGPKKMLVKLIGVWESDIEIGITYHFSY